MALIKIRNINGTSAYGCKCPSWLDHWKTYGKQKAPGFCPVDECLNKDLVGAHVQIDGYDRNWYIVPICTEHNAQRDASLAYNDLWPPVPANVGTTCGKK